MLYKAVTLNYKYLIKSLTNFTLLSISLRRKLCPTVYKEEVKSETTNIIKEQLEKQINKAGSPSLSTGKK